MYRTGFGALVVIGMLGGAPAAYGQAADSGPKIAIIDIQTAMGRTQEGQKLARELQEKYAPTSQKLEQARNEINTLRDQLNRGANTMSDDARRNLMRDIQSKERNLQRETEDAQAEANQEQQKMLNELGGKMMTVIDKYAKEKGYQVVLDISSPQSPVLYAINEVNITNDITTLYDQAHPVSAATSTPAAATPAAKPTQ